jgi:DNA replication and repair protein RecF
MPLAELTVDDLRCIERAELVLHPRHNLVLGSNGSGKTSVLEAIFLLGRGRSFRTRNSARLIRHGQARLVVFGRMDDVGKGPLGIQVHATEGTTAKIGGAPVRSLSELSQALAVQVIDPGVHHLVEEGGATRRRWLDWGVFHVEPQFLDTWVRYMRALKQRNAALKSQPSQATVWEPELARLGEQIAGWQGAFLERLRPYWRGIMSSLSGLEVELQYLRGWTHGVSLLEALASSRSRDELRGVTHPGPHRSDVAVKLQGRLAREVLSRGQQKLVAVAMTLAQLLLLQDTTPTTPTLLLDDPAAELDQAHLERFIEQVQRLRCQLIVTALTSDTQPFGASNRLFRVDRGRVQPV